MRAGRDRRARGLGLALAALMAAGAGILPARAQEGPVPAVPQAPILMVDRNRLMAETLFGKAVEARFKTENEALIAENLKLEQALESEERALTDRRKTLPAAEFQALASAFDAKTEDIRAAQDAKARAISARRDADRQKFLQAAVPVLGELMAQAGAVAVFDKDLVILSLRGVDITDEAIARIDAVLGDGSAEMADAPAEDAPAAVEAPAEAPAEAATP